MSINWTITVHISPYFLIIENAEAALRWGNSQYRKNLRRFEKNNLPFKCDCAICGDHFECRSIKDYIERRGVCWGCSFENKVKIAARTLYHLVRAIPQAERDQKEISPGDWKTALIPLPQRSNWDWRKLERWRREGMLLCGVSTNALLGRDTLGLRDYSESARLLFKFGKYELVTRQKAASAVRAVALDASYVAKLVPTRTQRALERCGRLYKNSPWPSKAERTLFDRCEASSCKAASWLEHRVLGLEGAVLLQAAIDRRERKASGGKVEILGSPAKRHANLASTWTAYNEKYSFFLEYRWPEQTCPLWRHSRARQSQSRSVFGRETRTRQSNSAYTK